MAANSVEGIGLDQVAAHAGHRAGYHQLARLQLDGLEANRGRLRVARLRKSDQRHRVAVVFAPFESQLQLAGGVGDRVEDLRQGDW